MESGSTPQNCLFCRIASGAVDAILVHQDDTHLAFLDMAPIRPGHTQIIPRAHVPYFESLNGGLLQELVVTGQALARRLKAIYEVPRVAFLFTGGDVPHVHAHVVPMHEDTDITSARYLVAEGEVSWRSRHLHVEREELRVVRDLIGPSSDWLD